MKYCTVTACERIPTSEEGKFIVPTLKAVKGWEILRYYFIVDAVLLFEWEYSSTQ